MVIFKELILIDMMDCCVSDRNLRNTISNGFVFMFACISSPRVDWTRAVKARQHKD